MLHLPSYTAKVSLTTDTPAEVDAQGRCTHWSVMPGTKRSRGKMIHAHTVIDEADTWCKDKHGNCGKHFPRTATPDTIIDENRRLAYRCDDHERMVVPYNPWISLYFRSHINVQCVSTTNVIYYLFKYLMKGLDKNKGQVVMRTERPRGTQAANRSSTHDRQTPRDEIREWRDLREICAPNAYWRENEYTSYGQVPSIRCRCCLICISYLYTVVVILFTAYLVVHLYPHHCHQRFLYCRGVRGVPPRVQCP